MARKPKSSDDLDHGDRVILRGEVTRVAENAAGVVEVTVQIDGYGQSRVTLPAEYVEKDEE